MPRPRPPKSDLEKQHDAERMKRDFRTLGYASRREEYAAFKAYCERRGKTVSGMIRAYVLSCLAEDAVPPDTDAPAEQNDTPEGGD